MTAIAGYDLSATNAVAQFALGTEINVDGNTYAYIKSGGAITQYAACTLSSDWVAVEGTTTTSGAKPTQFAIPQIAVSATDLYLWAPVGPFFKKKDGTAFYVRALTLAATGAKLYTTATAGCVDDTATDLIAGLTLTETVGGATANAACVTVLRLVSNCQD